MATQPALNNIPSQRPAIWAACFRQAARARFEHDLNYRRSSKNDALNPFYSFADETRRWMRAALSSRAASPVSSETEQAVMRVLRDWEQWTKLSDDARSAIRAVRENCEHNRALSLD